ncbi:phospholipid carrier-dependent glycosyltransferase, partial [bacterium]|nr:phospholipid carrier-dependent glycosyltransferase [bacterium]
KFDQVMHGVDSRGYHWTNLWLHLLVTLLAFLLIDRLQKDGITAFLAASLFAVHPVHTEAISWISGRTDLLCAAFYLLALNLFLAMDPRESKGCLTGILALIAGAMAMLTKEMGYTLPLVIIVVDRLDRLRDLWWRSYRSQHYASYFVLLAVVLGIRFLSVGQLIGGYGAEMHLQPSRIFTYFSSYLNFIIEPFAILSANNQSIHAIITISIILLSVVGLFSERTRLSIAFFWITILPVITICRAQYLYLPSLGLFWLLAILIRNAKFENRSLPGDIIRTIISATLILSCLIHSGKAQKNWVHSGWVAQGVRQSIQAFHPNPPDGTRVILLNPPQNNKLHMGVFQNGFSEAIRLWYSNDSLSGLRIRHPESFTEIKYQTDIVFECKGAEIREVTNKWREQSVQSFSMLPNSMELLFTHFNQTKTLPLSDLQPGSFVINSHLSNAADIPQGTPVAEFKLIFTDGHSETFTMLTGVHTSEWAIDRPDVTLQSRHNRASLSVAADCANRQNPPFLCYEYRSEWKFNAIESAQSLNIRYLLGKDTDSVTKPEFSIRDIVGQVRN